ncbi:MAG: alpha-E domain-containing protein, partial [Planctomycetota bacterium]
VDPWQPLVHATGDHEWFKEKYTVANASNVVRFMAFDTEYANSMISCLRSARENARCVRDSLSSESFQHLNDFYHFVRDAPESELIDPTADFFEKVRDRALMWTGILDTTMPHHVGWHFLNVGRLLERADKASRILDVKYFSLHECVEHIGTAVDDLQWSTLLQAISGIEAYRREHHLVDVEKIVSFFVFHKTFPRSIYPCIAGAEWSLRKIENYCESEELGKARRELSMLLHQLGNSDAKEVILRGMHEFVDQLQRQLNVIGDSLGNDFFHLTSAAS